MRIKKTLAILLSVLLLMSSISTVITGGFTVSAEETTETVIQNSPREFLKEQAIAYATAEGDDSPTQSKNRIAITQDSAWRVESAGVSNTTETATVSGKWADTKSLWVINSASNIRYGHSSWSYDCAHIRVGYKDGVSASGEALTAYLYPKKNNNDGDRRNAFLGLYYIAETSGDYTLSDNYGGFTVRESAASGYEVYVTILANGKEIFKSQALSRRNRIAKFGGETFYLEEGQKLEIKFTYEYTATTYNGDITIDFDPQLSLVDEYVVETPVLEGTGDVSQLLYNEIAAQSGTGSFVVTQTSPWRVQGYKSSVWSDLEYCKQSDMTGSNSLYARYMTTSSYTQSPHMGVRYYNTKLGNPKVIWVRMPLKYSNRRPVRLSYTAEADGVYTLSDKYGEICGIDGSALSYYEITVSVTVNNETIWTGENKIRAKGDSVKFDPIQVSLKKNDILAIKYTYSVRSDLAEGVTAETSGSFTMQFAPLLSYLPPAQTEEYPLVNSFLSAFDEVAATNPTTSVSGTLTQSDDNWSFKYGTSFEGLTNITKYSYNPSTSWGEARLHGNTDATGEWPSIKYRLGSDSPYGLMVHYRHRIKDGGIDSSGYHYNFAYTFKATRQGVHVLDETTFGFCDFYSSQIDSVLKIYKNSELIYTSGEINSTVTSTVIPKMNFMLNLNDELTFYFDRLDSDSTLKYNTNVGYKYIPTITYHKDGVIKEKNGYTPENTTRYYAEGLSVPTTVSAHVNTSAVVPGNIIDSDIFGMEVLANGNVAVNYLNGETEKQIVFPVNVKGNWNKLTVAYDTAKSAWSCSVNDIEIATVEDADFVAGGAIDKLYIGASADIYNNGSFGGEIAELTLFDGTATVGYTLSDIKNEAGLLSEAVTAESNCSETFLTFPNKNYRYDLYENFEVPVSTFEAWVRLKTEYVDGKSAGRLLGNSYNSKPYSQVNIISNGRPQVYACDADGNTATVTFNVDIRSDEFVHLAITADIANGLYSCYIDGVLVDTVESSMVIPVGTRPYLVSGDYFHNNTPENFEGDLAGLAMYSDVRTQEEIIADMYGANDLTDGALLGKWSMANNNEGLVNQNGNGNDLHPFWDTEADSTVDESYGDYSTFVFIPDTQNFTQSQGATGLNSIANWIIKNKKAENIVGVLGLGDITNKNTTDQWAAAKTAFDKLKGEVPYVFVQGNHDIGSATTDAEGNTVYRNTTNMNTYFPLDDWKPYINGYYEEGKIDNMYILTEDNKGVKYMLLGLEFQPRDEVLQWANEVVSAHPNYNVIVSTHGYQNYDYYTKEQNYIGSNDYADIVGTNQNTGNLMWEKFVSQHANITTVVCGHVYHEDIHVTTNEGVNGNTVTEIIANAQTTDALMRMSGTIMILRVSEDGTKANVNYYAPYHGHYLKDLNQFEMDWNTIMPEDNVAEINGVAYSSLAEAIKASVEGDEITLTTDIEVAAPITLDKAITVNFNGFNINSLNGEVFNISAAATITGNGVLTPRSGYSAVTVSEDTQITVTGGSFVNFSPVGDSFDYIPEGFGVKCKDNVYTAGTSAIISDTDGDKYVSASDLSYLRGKIMGNITDSMYYDTNGDGKFNAIDIVRAKKISVQ